MFWRKFWRRRKRASEAGEYFRDTARRLFPGGTAQLDAEATQLRARLDHRVSLDEARRILAHATGRVFIGLRGPSPEADVATRCIESIRSRAGGALDDAMAKEVYEFVLERMDEGATAKGRVVGNVGSPTGKQTAEADPVIEVPASTTLAGIAFEHDWLGRHFGERNKDWFVLNKTLETTDDGKVYETFTVSTRDGDRRVITFDISAFYGHW